MAFAAVVVFAAQANAATDIAYWNIDTLNISPASLPGSGNAPNSLPADGGTGSGSSTLYFSPDHTTTHAALSGHQPLLCSHCLDCGEMNPPP